MPRLWSVLLCLATAAAQEPPDLGKGVNFYSIERETALGNQLAADFRRNSRILESPRVLAYVERIAKQLAAQIKGPPFTYTLALIAGHTTPVHEIVAVPGGFLFVPASLILAVKDEDELAGMLAHAIVHIAARHGTRQATRAQLAKVASIPLIYHPSPALVQAQSLAIPLGLLHMWRQCELDADVWAVRNMSEVGYDPAALARYIERVQPPDDTDSKIGSATPQRSQRLETIRSAIAALPSQVYGPRDSLEKVQEEVRRLTTAPAKPPSLSR